MDTERTISNSIVGALIAGAALICSVPEARAGCPFDRNDPLLNLRAPSDLAIVKIITTGSEACTSVGTGFFISPSGHILTAGHVVPPQCDNDRTSISVQWSKVPQSRQLEGPFPAKVVGRSNLDVLLLSLVDKPDISRQYLRPSPKLLDPSTLKDSCILLASHYYEQTDTYSTFAEISSVSLDGDKRWAVSGDGFNPSRSGSPVILPNGEVAAIFVARPIDPSDRTNIFFSRGYVQPLAMVPAQEIDIERYSTTPGELKPFLTLNAVTSAKLSRFITSFGISVTEPGYRSTPPFYLIDPKSGALSRASDSLSSVLGKAFTSGQSVVRKVDVRRDFAADPGYAFDEKSIKYKVASINPTTALLPTMLCDEKQQDNCIAMPNDRTSMQLRFSLYPGVDGRNSWVDAEIHVAQVLR